MTEPSTAATPSTTDWFFMKGGRQGFVPHPLRDKKVMFCHRDVQATIQSAIQQAYAFGRPIKLILWGDWGVGKTHALRHLESWLEDHAAEFPTLCVYVEIGDLDPHSSFAAIHKDLVEGVGLQTVLRWAHEYNRLQGSLLRGLEGIGVPVHIRDVMNRLLMSAPGTPPIAAVQTAWQYLKGEDMGRASAQLGISESLTESRDFYYVLASLGHLCQVVDQKRLLFMVDEAAKLDEAGLNATMVNHWVNVNKLIFDNDNTFFGFIYTVSGKNERALPKEIYHPQIQNRLGNSRRLQLRTLETDDIREFLKNLFDEFVDSAAVAACTDVTGSTGYNVNTYPFTDGAYHEFVDFYHRAQADSKPRDIAEKVDAVAWEALRNRKRLIDEQCLRQQGL